MKENKIRVGDKVFIINNGGGYTTFTSFIKEYNFYKLDDYIRDNQLNNGEEVIVLNIEKHLSSNYILCIVQKESDGVGIINIRDVKLVSNDKYILKGF